MPSDTPIQIIETYNSFEFYDGAEIIQDCKVNVPYEFGTTSGEGISNAYLSFEDTTVGQIKIPLFSPGFKYLSNFAAPIKGFEPDDLFELLKILNLDASRSKHYELKFKKHKEYFFFAVVAILGGRGPEGMEALLLMKVKMKDDFKEKYFK